MVTRDEIYRIVSTFLDNNFEKDLTNKKFYLKKKLSESEINDLTCSFANLLGNKLVPMHDMNEIRHDFKISSRYIEVDNQSIKCDGKGRLYVDVENFVNQDELITKLMENEDFYNKIVENFKPTELTMKYIKKFLLMDPEYLSLLAALLPVIQKVNSGELDKSSLETLQKQFGLLD